MVPFDGFIGKPEGDMEKMPPFIAGYSNRYGSSR
jgi:hypothetical protein